MTTPEERARRKEIAGLLGQISEAHRNCRRYGHTWRPFTAYRLAKGRGWEETVRCASCSMERRELLDSDGFVIRNAYTRPEGYSIVGLGRLTGGDRGALRIAAIKDHLTGDN